MRNFFEVRCNTRAHVIDGITFYKEPKLHGKSRLYSGLKMYLCVFSIHSFTVFRAG